MRGTEVIDLQISELAGEAPAAIPRDARSGCCAREEERTTSRTADDKAGPSAATPGEPRKERRADVRGRARSMWVCDW